MSVRVLSEWEAVQKLRLEAEQIAGSWRIYPKYRPALMQRVEEGESSPRKVKQQLILTALTELAVAHTPIRFSTAEMLSWESGRHPLSQRAMRLAERYLEEDFAIGGSIENIHPAVADFLPPNERWARDERRYFACVEKGNKLLQKLPRALQKWFVAAFTHAYLSDRELDRRLRKRPGYSRQMRKRVASIARAAA